ncbi:MAG TPA: oligosaccharide flippase family protein [Fibrobacteria bacterium]|nr:oligosaccharide flippase family protein [Fibrobacteria bacterium]
MDRIAIEAADPRLDRFGEVQMLRQLKLPRIGRIGSGTIWSVLGLVIPLVAAFVSIPVLVDRLGMERFGVLTLCWALAGYFNLFDMGLGRALVLRISRLEGEERSNEVPSSFWTGTTALLGVGALLGGISAAASVVIARDLLQVPIHLQKETALSLAITGLTLPFGLAYGGFGNFLVASHRQREANLLRIPTGIVSHLGAAALVMAGGDLIDLAWLNLGIRIVSLVAVWMVVNRVRHMPFGFSRIELYALLGMGSWMMVTNLLAPLATQLDRFLVGRLAGLTSVAHYSTSMDLALKAWILLASLAPVLLPILGELAVRDRAGAKRIFHKALVATMCAGIPALGGMQLLGHLGLTMWIGEAFADSAWSLLAVLCSGVLASLMSNLAFNLVQAFEGPRRTAIAHAILLPVHIGLVLLLAPRFGAMGAVIAYLVRCFLEAAIFFWMAAWHDMVGGGTLKALALGTGLHLGLMSGLLSDSIVARCAVIAVAVGVSCFWWFATSADGHRVGG